MRHHVIKMFDCFFTFSQPKKSRHLQTYPHEESIFDIMTSGPTPITTLLLVKPRALKRHFPKILKKIMYEGYQIVGFHLGMLNKEKIDNLLEADMQVRKLNKFTRTQDFGT